MRKEFALSIEELILSLHMIGQTETAAALVRTIIGEISEQEIETRLLVAGHSLMAREWLEIVVEADGGRQLLNAELAAAIALLGDADFSLGLQQVAAGGEKKLMFHFKGDKVIQHDSSIGVVQKIVIHNDKQSAIEEASRLYAINSFSHMPVPDNSVTPELLENLSSYWALDLERIRSIVEVAGIHGQVGNALAEDLKAPENLTNVMRIDYHAEEGPICDAGFLMLEGKERLWIFRQETSGDTVHFTLLPGSIDVFHSEMAKLMAPKHPLATAVN